MVAGCWVFWACSPSGAVGAALHQDLATLQREIALAQRSGELDSGEIEKLARAVITREIHSSWGARGVRRVRATRACASAALDVLRRRSLHTDEVAAEAMLVRIAQNDVSPGALVLRHRNAQSGAWRAVAARAALEPGDFHLRRRWFLDSEPGVRRAALEAARVAPEPSDLPALLEVFRLDPDPLSRSLAARAAGVIGGELSVLGLSDRLARAEPPEQLAVVDAWSMPRSFRAGGARELRRLVEAKQGIVSIAAARALLQSAPSDGSVIGHLLMAAEHGTEEERRLAILFLPLTDPRSGVALATLAMDRNPKVRVMSVSRLLAVPTHRTKAIRSLQQLAKKDDTAAVEARFALAASGDRSVIPALTRDLARAHPLERQSAALWLFRLGEPSKAAAALGDDDPGVRLAVSCGILGSRRP